MDFSNIDFSRDCFVELHVVGYGAISGLFFSDKNDIIILETFFKDSHDWQPSFEHEGRKYVMGFVDPGNLNFQQFMQNEAGNQKVLAEGFYKKHGFYEQTHDFFDVWDDSDISDVQISFPVLNKA